MMIIILVEYLASFVEALLGILFNAEAFTQKKIKWKSSLMFAAGISAIILAINTISLFSVFATIFAVLGIAIGACLIYKTGFWDAFLLTVFYLILLYSVDFLVITGLAIFFHNKDFVSEIVSRYSYRRLLMLIVSKFLLFVLFYFLKKRLLYKLYLRTGKMWIGIAVSIGIVYLLVKYTFFDTDTMTFFSWGSFLMLMISAAYILTQYHLFLQERCELYMVKECHELMLKHYGGMIQNYKEAQVFYHDLKNHVLVIENYLKEKEYEKAEAYIDALRVYDHIKKFRERTGIKALDIMIECKKQELDSVKIKLEIATTPVSLPMSEQEMTALFGNALDNAIEACKKVEVQERWIRIVIRKIHEMTVIKISNSFMDEPVLRREKFATSKENKNLHGLGISSMKMIVERYGGTVGIEYDTKMVCLMITLFN